MTTTLAPADAAPAVSARRREAAAILRAVADLMDARPDLPEPDASISVFVSPPQCGDVLAALADITAALPGPWQANISRSGAHAWLDLTCAAAGSSTIKGTTFRVSAPAQDACAPSGTRTVTTWRPLPAVAALLPDSTALEEL